MYAVMLPKSGRLDKMMSLYAYLESELHHLLDYAVVVVHVAARAQLLLPMGEPTPENWGYEVSRSKFNSGP